MFELVFYRDNRGVSDVSDYLDELGAKAVTSKTDRINRNKILAYMKVLSIHGAQIGEPYVKQLDDDIWELRPLKNRILFFFWKDGKYVLLHHFIKKSQRTPKREIEQARREMYNHLERNKE